MGRTGKRCWPATGLTSRGMSSTARNITVPISIAPTLNMIAALKGLVDPGYTSHLPSCWRLWPVNPASIRKHARTVATVKTSGLEFVLAKGLQPYSFTSPISTSSTPDQAAAA